MAHEEEVVEVVIVGWSGIAAAKAYLQCAPDTNLLVLDANQSIGGTWAEERLYEGLRSNNLRGTFEYPDYPLHDGFGVKEGEYLPGPVLHQYITEYAKHFNVYDKIQFQSRATCASRVKGEKRRGWQISVQTPKGEYTIFTAKLIVATGLTSQPQKMYIRGQEVFNAPLTNTAKLATDGRKVKDDPNVRRVTVFGGGKSAYDAVYMFASAGKEVDWIIRKSGHGPTWMGLSNVVIGSLGKFWVETLVTRRIIAWMSPCLWGDGDGSGWWRSLLHETWLGRKVVDMFWWKLGSDILEQAGYNNDPSLETLRPDCSVFETATSIAILNYPTDILDLVRSARIKVHRKDLDHLDDHGVHSKDGTYVASDAFVASTGWSFKPAIDFSDKHLHSELGIPSIDLTKVQQDFWRGLDSKADAEVFSRWPKLKELNRPACADNDGLANPFDEIDPNITPRDYTPWRLYRSLAPPGLAAEGDRSLTFAGYSLNFTGHIRNEIAGLWIWAYMNDKLSIDPCRDVADICYDAALLQRFCYRRAPWGFGRRFPDFVFDAVPWNDLLLKDLGLSGTRKGGSWYRECFEPYSVADYRGITAEWLAKNKLSQNKYESSQ
ncbi:hypothetical protein LTS14_002475 [Recurvomyces mirabilis]|uniref:uncharacterized protein n=1 Tax=Recurvomyces mirabilis TaxID=574656 RepID=UPI002DDE1AEC|nr:hypothetical protein LTS14_002475 [Recurvomyces mirabilis]